MKRVRIDSRAAEEFDAAADWYEARETGLGREFIKAVQATVDQLVDMPTVAARVPLRSTKLVVRRLLVRKFPYAVVFAEQGDEIVIVAIAHGHRRPGYWKERIET